MKRVLFVHRSVGQNLLRDGGIYDRKRSFELYDYNQNTDTLSDKSGTVKQLGFSFPDSDTTPASYAAILQSDTEYSEIRDYMLSYDVLVLKSCYPNSNIQSDEQLEMAKDYYQSIASFMQTKPHTKLLLLTSPPLRRSRTTRENAKRAQQLHVWLSEQDFGSTVCVFDFYSKLADATGQLRRDYQRLMPFDSHPNAKASQVIAPQFIQSIEAVV